MRAMVGSESASNEAGNESGEAMRAVNLLSGWINENYPHSEEPITHLKLQKLLFYCYGALLAHDLETEIASVPLQFEAWEHGPVSREAYVMFRAFGSAAIPPSSFVYVGSYSERATSLMKDILNVYGRLSAWNLRQQSHTEVVWKDSFERKEPFIDAEKMKAFFKAKFGSGIVAAPEYLFGVSNFSIDGIPVQHYSDLPSLAKAVGRVFKNQKP